MAITGLRLLPPLAFARLGSAADPLDSYTLQEDPDHPLGYRRIEAAETLIVDDDGYVTKKETQPDNSGTFKQDGHIRPVAPFFEVFAVIGNELHALDSRLLRDNDIDIKREPERIAWRVVVANRKVFRRTGDPGDVVTAETPWFSDHRKHVLKGSCDHFVKEGRICFGHVQYVRPASEGCPMRLRFTPAKGLIYGPDSAVCEPDKQKPPRIVPVDRAIYDTARGMWQQFDDQKARELNTETLPPSLFASRLVAPPWLHGDKAASRGYLDDACDGFVEVRMLYRNGKYVEATARICVGPPAVVPDSLFVRTLKDDLEQVLLGPEVDEAPAVLRKRAEEIVRRAYETVRFANVAVMNGNVFKGRPALALDTMPAEEAFASHRRVQPVWPESSVDTLAILALHQHVFAALRSGAAPWFAAVLRRPEEVADYTDRGRRKMPALMCGADSNYLALTRRQIDIISKAAIAPSHRVVPDSTPVHPVPRNRTAYQLSDWWNQLNHEATGNPVCSRPETVIANCCPGLEVDFRAVWRRIFVGIELREWDNLVVRIEPGLRHLAKRRLKGHRLLRIRFKESSGRWADPVVTVTQMRGPSPANTDASVVLATYSNPYGVVPLEWSNALARVLRSCQGKTAVCDFTKERVWGEQRPCIVDTDTGALSVPVITCRLRVRRFFETDAPVISKQLALEGELTQGLCSPWQNDYRECSCFYWASARPDYVNVQPSPTGASAGDNWLQQKRTGDYVPDDYEDDRLITYDNLFEDWEKWLRFQVGGRDVDPEGKHG